MRSKGDRGSVSLWLIIFALAVFVLLGFVVDGGQYMNARERAADIAQQAARAAVGQVSIGDLRKGDVIIPGSVCDPGGPAYTLVSNYAGNGATIPPGGCQVTTVGACELNPPADPVADAVPCVAVTVDVTVNPAIPISPFGTFTAEATEPATLDCGNQIEQTGFC